MTQHLTGIQRASWPMGVRITLLLSAILWVLILSLAAALAQTAQAPGPPAPEALQAEAARLTKAAAAALATAQNAAQLAAMAAQAPAQFVAAPSPQTITIPAEVRDAVVSLCMALITAGIATGLAWMRSHLAFMKEAEANAAITSSAQGLGALLEQALAKQGKSLSTVDISDPMVAATARKLIAAFPEWGPLVGLTPDIAERKVLAGAIQHSVVPLVPTAPVAIAPVAVVQPTPPPAVMEAAMAPQ